MSDMVLVAQLERLVDRHDLAGVLAALVEVCGEKAEHLRVNWQDAASAQMWERMAKRLDKQVSACNVLRGIV